MDMTEVKNILEAQGVAFKNWSEKQSDRLNLLEGALEELQKKANRPQVGGSGGTYAPMSGEERKSFDLGVRALLAGDKEKAYGLFVQAKAMNTGSGPDGGYVVHTQFSNGVTKAMAEISPLYRLARVIDLDPGNDSFEEPIDSEQAEGGWVGEQQSRDDTDTPPLKMFSTQLHELYAMPKATQKLIDTSSMDIMGWLQEKVGETFGVMEGTAYHTGDGIARPRGFLAYDTATTADATRAWGTIQYIATGQSGAFATPSATVSPADKLIDLTMSLRKQYRAGAVWLMNSNTAGAVRKFKDAEGRFVWTDSIVAGQPPTLLGYPVEIDEEMPDINANSLSIAFGNFKRAYTIIQKPGIKFLPDPYSSKPHVLLYAYRRVGAGLNNSQAVKLLKFGTS